MSNGWGEGHLNNSIGWGNSEYTRTEVDITSAQILAMGATPIELLPAAGANKYYDIEKIIIEYTHVTTDYTLGTVTYLSALVGSDYAFELSSGILANGASKYAKMTELGAPDAVEGLNYNSFFSLNSALSLTTYDGSEVTLGDGTMRVIVYSNLRTFGA